MRQRQLFLWLVSISMCRICCLAAAAESESGFAGAGDNKQEVLRRYVDAATIRREALRGVEMEVNIYARLPKLNKDGLLRAVRRVSCSGKVSYRILNYLGDGTIRREAIARYLAADIDTSTDHAMALTAANYEFHSISTPGPGPEGRWKRGFRVKPKNKRVGLFKGEVWFDDETGMPARESGQFVKNPSVFLKKISFVHEYEIRDGISIPKRIQSTIETRIAGRVEFTVLFSDFAYADTGEAGCQSVGADPWRLTTQHAPGR